MTTNNDRAYYGWTHEGYPDRDESEDVLVSRMLDHGSINFGRFAIEPLSWEKRSVFALNKCQEELEKFKAPGLVAQKKAYFEEYYRKVRVQKALQEGQQIEIASGYTGDDDCVSSEIIGEEEEGKNSQRGKMIVGNDLLEESRNQISVEREVKFNDFQARSLDSDASNLHASRAMQKFVEGMSSHPKNDSEMHYSEAGIQESRLLVISTEIVEPTEPLLVNGIGISKAEESVSNNAYLKISNGSTNATGGDLKLTSGQKVVKSISKQAVRESKMTQLSYPKKHYAAVRNNSMLEKETPPVTARSDLKLEHKTSISLVNYSLGAKAFQKLSNKAESRSNLSKPIPNAYSAVKKYLKVEQKTHPNSINISHKAKELQISSNKAESSSNSCKEISNRSLSKKQSAICSNRVAESSSTVTVPHPFSFATHRRAVISSGIRETTTKMDSRMSRRPKLETVPAKNAAQPLKVSSLNAPAISTAKGRGLEIRVHEVAKKGISARGSGLKYPVNNAAQAIHTVGQQKFMSLNTRSQSKSISNFEHDKRKTRNALGYKGKEAITTAL